MQEENAFSDAGKCWHHYVHEFCAHHYAHEFGHRRRASLCARIRPRANGDRSAMAFMHAPIKALQNAGPTAPPFISAMALGASLSRGRLASSSEQASQQRRSLLAVRFLLVSTLCCPVLSTSSRPMRASVGTTWPGIGGFCHGRRFPVSARQQRRRRAI